MAKTPPPDAVVRIEGKPIPSERQLSATEARDKFQSVLSKDQTHERSGKALAVELAEFWDWGGPRKMGWESAEAYMTACLTTIKTRRTLYRAIAYGRAQWHLKSVTHGSHFAKLPERTLRPVIEVAGDDPEAMMTVLEEAWELACNDQKGQRAAQGSKKQPPRMTSGHTRRAVEALYGRQGRPSDEEDELSGEISRRARDWREFSKNIDKCQQIAQFHGGHLEVMDRLDWLSHWAQERLT